MNRLFHVPLSPYCRKVRLSLAEKKIEVELVEEKYWEQDPDFLRRNPAGKVPVLKMDGMTMAESAPICEYLEEAYPKNPNSVTRCAAWSAGLTINSTTKSPPTCCMSG